MKVARPASDLGRAPPKFAASLLTGVAQWAERVESPWVTAQMPLPNMTAIRGALQFLNVPYRPVARNYSARTSRIAALSASLGVRFEAPPSAHSIVPYRAVLRRWDERNPEAREATRNEVGRVPAQRIARGPVPYEPSDVVPEEEFAARASRFREYVVNVARYFPYRDILVPDAQEHAHYHHLWRRTFHISSTVTDFLARLP